MKKILISMALGIAAGLALSEMPAAQKAVSTGKRTLRSFLR